MGQALIATGQAINLDHSDEYLRGASNILLVDARGIAASYGASNTPELAPTIANAIQAAQNAATMNPRDPVNWGNLGSVYETVMPLVAGADVAAEQSYEKAASFDSENPQWYFATGRVFMEAADLLPGGTSQDVARQADWTQAEAALEKALSLKNDYADPRILLVQLYLKEGNISQAIQRVQELKQQNPLDSGVAFELGYLYYQNNQIDQAQEEFQVAVILDPNYSNARYFLGMIYNQKGLTTQALDQFQRVAALNPDNQQVKNIIASLQAGQSLPASAASSNITPSQPNEISIPKSQTKSAGKGK